MDVVLSLKNIDFQSKCSRIKNVISFANRMSSLHSLQVVVACSCYKPVVVVAFTDERYLQWKKPTCPKGIPACWI
jgi:hypothetical protein